MNRKWNEKNTLEKTVTIISGIALCVWLILGYIENKAPYAETISYIALCVVCVCEAVAFWNTKRVISYIAIGGMILMLTALVLLAL